MPDPLVPGRCDSCGGPIPAEPDPRVARSRQHRLCSRRCENREKHRREYRRYTPELARQTECERKDRYSSREAAEVVQSRHLAEDGRFRAVYECQWCRSWHLGGYARPEGG